MCQVRDDGLAAVARVAPNQVVEQAALGAEAVDRAGLVHVEMRRPVGDGIAQQAATLRVGLRRRELETTPVKVQWNLCGLTPGRDKPCRHGGAAKGAGLQDLATPPGTARRTMFVHGCVPP